MGQDEVLFPEQGNRLTQQEVKIHKLDWGRHPGEAQPGGAASFRAGESAWSDCCGIFLAS